MNLKEEYVEEASSVEHEYVTERNKPMPSKNHSRIQTKVGSLITVNYEDKYVIHSELTLNLEDWVAVPDLSIYPFTPYNPLEDEIKVTDAPLGAIEILSPKQSQSDLVLKAQKYFEKGVKSVWIIFPALQNIYVFSSALDYEIYRKGEVLKDNQLEIELDTNRFF